VFFKRGTYIQRKMVESTLSFKDIPEKHNAKSNPDLLVKRSVYQELDIPILSRITNRVDFVFNGETPLEMKS